MPLECHAASPAGFTKEMPIRIEVVKEANGLINVSWLNAPAAIETLNVTRRSGPIRPDVK
jgi:hypothetical protein